MLLLHFVQLVADFEVSCRQNLENSIPIVFKEQNIIIGVIPDRHVSEALRCEEPLIRMVLRFEPLHEDAHSKLQVRLALSK